MSMHTAWVGEGGGDLRHGREDDEAEVVRGEGLVVARTQGFRGCGCSGAGFC